jgi:predicted dehydrogenase
MLNLGVLSNGVEIKSEIEKIRSIPEIGDINTYKLNGSDFGNGLDLFIENSDLIVVDSINDFNFEIALNVLRKSKHLYILNFSKLSSKLNNEFLNLANEANVKLQVSRPQRFNPLLLKAKEFISNPLYIEAHRFCINNNVKSVVYDIMLNDIDIILNLVNSPVKKVFASGINILSNQADIVNARIEFDNSCVANITAGNVSKNEEARIKFIQPEGSIGIDYLNNNLELMQTDNSKGKKDVNISKFNIRSEDSLSTDFQSFVKAIQNNDSLENSITNFNKAIDIADEIINKI